MGGEIDIASVEDLAAGLLAEVDTARADLLIVDVSAVTFIDSTGLGLLYGLRKHQQAHDGRIALAGASPMLVKLLHITGMDKILPLLHDTPDEIYQAPDAAGERAGTLQVATSRPLRNHPAAPGRGLLPSSGEHRSVRRLPPRTRRRRRRAPGARGGLRQGGGSGQELVRSCSGRGGIGARRSVGARRSGGGTGTGTSGGR